MTVDEKCVADPIILEENSFTSDGRWPAKSVLTYERCEVEGVTYWIGKELNDPEAVGFVIDWGCSLVVRSVILRNAHRNYGRYS